MTKNFIGFNNPALSRTRFSGVYISGSCAIAKITCLLAGLFFLISASCAQTPFSIREQFESSNHSFTRVGRGICRMQEGILQTQNAYACFGDSDWTDYQFKFTSKVPASANQVQIWAGFRAGDRNDRYVIALKGGIQNDLYLARLGDMGADDFLALRHLNFSLKPGKDYSLKVQVVGDRIRIFIGKEPLPRIDVTDPHASFAPEGKITLGGGWIENDFSALSMRSLPADMLTDVAVNEYKALVTDKGRERRIQRAVWRPVRVGRVSQARTRISLDGKWLFKPGYEVAGEQQAISPAHGDSSWHVLTVPAFWNPDRIWLFGERYGTASKGVSDSYYQKEIDRCAAYTFDYKKTHIGWYRQWIDLPRTVSGKHLELCFDAVSKMADIWKNGRKAGHHTGMFGDFKIDATGMLKPGMNLLAVKVYQNYLKDTGNTGKVVGVAVTETVTQKMLKDLPHGFYDDDPAGIWQPVSLVITNPVKITDVFIKPDMQGATFDITLKNFSSHSETFSLNTHITSCKTARTLYQGISLDRIQLNPGEQKKLTYAITHLRPALWSPEHPNLYDFNFMLRSTVSHKIIDDKRIRSGFKTFVAKDGYFYLNGKRYWLRGADQTAMPIAPEDTALAERFCQLMHQGNINVTRTHTAPYTEVWMDASDEHGTGISYEGTWPWLMLGDTPIPDTALLALWKNEYFNLMRKYRNHPSLLIWTINNEMNFYADDPDKDRAKKKMEIMSGVVKQMRKIDPTHPICFSSNYSRRQTEKRFGKAFMKTIDDGDMDDIHYYPNWYNKSIFDDFKGQFQQEHKYPGRPLISQELSTGYPDETGHATRFYTFVHQTPQAVIGNYAYAYNDPDYFLKTNAFITKEEAEALRRTNPEAAGILHFSLATWFANVYLAKKIKPFPTYYAIKKALQPVLVSAELWGRHFYAGTRLPVRVCIVNDAANGKDLPATTLKWQLVDEQGKPFAAGTQSIPAVKYYGRRWLQPAIIIPSRLPADRVKGRLVLKLYAGRHLVSANDYALMFATKKWAADNNALAGKKILVWDPSGILLPVLDSLKIPYHVLTSVSSAIATKADEYLFAGLDSANVSPAQIKDLRKLVGSGANVLISHASDVATRLFPGYIRGLVGANSQIVNMDIPESPVFDGISPLDIRYFNNNSREIPTVCSGAFQVKPGARINALASSLKVHGYLQGDIEVRVRQLERLKGFPLVKIDYGRGSAVLSTMLLKKGITDPVAARLLTNLLESL